MITPTKSLAYLDLILSTISYFLFPVSSIHAAGGDIDLKEDIQRTATDLPIKSTFDITQNTIQKSSGLSKVINDSDYRVAKGTTQSGITTYQLGILGVSANYWIKVDDKTKQILVLDYYFPYIQKMTMDQYNTFFEELLPIITEVYGSPTKEGYKQYQGKDYKYVQFHEKGKYNYYLGIDQHPSAGFTLRFTIRALTPGEDPTSILLTQKAYEFFNNKQYDAALETFTKAIEQDPDNKIAYQGRVITYASKSMFDKVIEEETKLLETAPEYPQAYSLRGNAYYQKGMKEKAKEDFISFLKYANPSDPAVKIIKDILNTMTSVK